MTVRHGNGDSPTVSGLPAADAAPVDAAPVGAAPVEAAPVAAAELPNRTDRTSGVVRATSTMAIATLVSRITGFVSKAVILAFLGMWVVNDAYNLANTLPNIIFELLIGGVLASVAIPLLARAAKDPDGGVRYTQQLMTLTLVALAIATAFAMLTAPWLIRLYQGDEPESLHLATQLSYLLLPQILFYGVAALMGAILNTQERFAAPAWAPVVNNVVVIAVGVMLLTTTGGTTNPLHGMTTLTNGQFLLLGLGTTAGIVAQAAVMVPSLRRSGFQFRFRFGIDERMREAGLLMAWAIVYALTSQAGYIVITRVTRHTRDGLFGLFNHGSMLFQMPYGILGVSLLTAIMPRLSRHAASGDLGRVKHDVILANRLSTLALVPVTAAMMALAVPLAIVAARYGRVQPDDVHILGLTLAAFAIGLLPLAITLVQMRVFYAMKDGRTPALINAIMVAVRIPLLIACLYLPDTWVVPGLAAGISVSYIVGVVVGEIWLRARFGAMGSRSTVLTIGKAAAVSAVAGLTAWWVVQALFEFSADTAFLVAIGQLAVGGVIGLALIGAGYMLLRVPEAEALRRKLIGRAHRGHGIMDSNGADVAAQRHPVGHQQHHDNQRDLAHEPTINAQDTSVTDEHTSPPGHGPGNGASDGSPVSADTPSVPTSGPSGFDAAGAGPLDPGSATPATSASTAPQHTDFTPPSLATASADNDRKPGMVIGGRYRLTRLLAQNSVGHEFWLARDVALPRDMAITVVPHIDPTSSTITRTLRASRLGHPGLPQMLDMGSIGQASYIASLWVDGATLPNLLTDGPLEPAIAARVIAGAAEAVREIHAAGLTLGRIHPTTTRVGMDGQVRISHLVSEPHATAQDDIRALGALTYLALTGHWPLDPSDAPATVPAAPRRGDKELRANKLVASVPESLSRLASDALHVSDRHPLTAADMLDRAQNATLSDTVGLGGTAHVGGGLAASAGAGTVSGTGAVTGFASPAPGETAGSSNGPMARPQAAPGAGRPPSVVALTVPRRVTRDRRIKLTIAGAMLIALSTLILITASTVAKNVLADIVAPIQVAEAQVPRTVAPATTTRVVPATPDTTAPSSDGEPESTADGPTAEPVKITGATVYDPQGTPPADYESSVDRAFDQDPGTSWPTWVYKQQFGPGGIKDGVGLVLTLDKTVAPRTVTLLASTPDTKVEIRSISGPGAALDDTAVLGTATLGSDPVTIELTDAPESDTLLMWITQLAPYQGTSAENQGSFQSEIAEIEIAG